MRFLGIHWYAGLISVGSLAGLTSVLLVLEMAAVRILYAMSRDHFISKRFQAIHPKFKTPALLTWTVGLLAVVGILTLNLDVAAELCNYGTFTSFIIVCVSCFKKIQKNLRTSRRAGKYNNVIITKAYELLTVVLARTLL